MIVLDASVVVDILLRSADVGDVEDRVLSSAQDACTPHLLDIEIAQVLRRYCRAGRLTSARGREALADLQALPLTRFPHAPLFERIWELRQNLTAYDATYIALAESLGAELLTRDRRMASAPGHAAAIRVL